jgi:hypothetical protein
MNLVKLGVAIAGVAFANLENGNKCLTNAVGQNTLKKAEFTHWNHPYGYSTISEQCSLSDKASYYIDQATTLVKAGLTDLILLQKLMSLA